MANSHDRVAQLTSALEAGRSLEALSRELGIPLRELELHRAFAEAAHRRSERLAARRRWRAWTIACLGAVTAVGLLSKEALAATCVQTLPAPMVTFCPDTPARADQVNANFQQLATWLQQKTGALGSSNVTVTGSLSITAPDGGAGTLTMNGSPLFGGNVTVDGGIVLAGGLGQSVTLATSAYGVGAQTNTTYFRSPSAFAWYRGGVHNDAQWNAGGGATSMRLTDTGELLSMGLKQVGNALPTPYEVSSGRLLVDAPPSSVGVVVPINQAALDNLCRDDDGCPFTISMVNYAGDGRAATRSGTLFLSQTSTWWRVEISATDGEAQDADSSVGEVSAWDCFFTDAETASDTNNGRVDNRAGFGLLNCKGCTYSDTLTTFRMVFRD